MSDRQFNLADLFEIAVDTVPGRLALVAGSTRLTYAGLDARSNRFAHHLESIGLPTGTHVGILARNRAEWIESMIGSYKVRCVPINLNYRYVAPELRYVVGNADLRVLVYERGLATLVADALADVDPPAVPHLLVIDDGTPADGPDLVMTPVGSAPPSYEEALAAESELREFAPRSPDDLYVLYTGGTTGMPKGVIWRQEDIFFAAMGGEVVPVSVEV